MAVDTHPSRRLVSFVEGCRERAPVIYQEFGQLFPKAPRHPILFFGPLETARVLTVGLNPSTTEFKPWRCWQDELSGEKLSHRLHNYFKLSYPGPHPWFAEPEEALRIINCSYAESVAHIDVSPWATFGPKWCQQRKLLPSYKKLLAREVRYLSALVKFCPGLKLVIILVADQECELAMSAITSSFADRVEIQRKNQLTEWVWRNKNELANLVESKAVDCRS